LLPGLTIDAPYVADQEDLSEGPGFVEFVSERLLQRANYRELLNQAGDIDFQIINFTRPEGGDNTIIVYLRLITQ
jgi:hypothetical protein